MLAKARTEPTDRSMPAEEMTKVAPIARTPMTEVARRMLRKFETLRKNGERIDIAAIRTASTTSNSSRM